MDRERLKQRIVGAIVLVALGVIFIPYILSQDAGDGGINETNIKPKPDELVVLEQRQPAAKPEPVKKPEQITTPLKPEKPPRQADKTPLPEPDIENPPAQPDDSQQAKPEVTDKAVWVVQVASFSSRSNAMRLRDKLNKDGYTSFVESVSANGKTIYRVRVGPYIKRTEADSSQKKIIKKYKLNAVVMNHS